MAKVQPIGVMPYHSPGQVDASVVNSSTGLRVAGVQVVGPQAAAVSDLNLGALTLLTDVITAIGTVQTQVNLLLARVRSHGLIAP